MMLRALIVVAVGSLLAAAAEAQVPAPAGKVTFADVKQKYSYAIGSSLGRNLKGKIDTDMLVRGLRDAAAGAEPALTDAEMEQVIGQFEQEMMNTQMKEVTEKNKAEGDAFLAQNAKQPGVVTLPSGLQYKVLKQGNGASPKPTDTVTVNYSGKLLSGQEFANSTREGKPLTMRVDQFVQGWIEALPMMKIGDKWTLYIPSNLAYKDQGRPPVIPPAATLIFEIELLGINQ
ncbi:MAG: FKBP-type peptidyl-prolyl cis-trans isomerase [Planctomycetes bacterium]|nr:FKBP-type peptidyl-prolyl cis-trans isomerase [Planctomycetota bacterium]